MGKKRGKKNDWEKERGLEKGIGKKEGGTGGRGEQETALGNGIGRRGRNRRKWGRRRMRIPGSCRRSLNPFNLVNIFLPTTQ